MSHSIGENVTRWQAWLAKEVPEAGASLTTQNQVEILVDAAEFMPRMLDLIKKSKRAVTYQFFGIEADPGGRPFAETLIGAKARGVSVKILLDSVELFIRTNGRWAFLPFQKDHVRDERKATKEMLAQMEAMGIEIYRYGWRYLFRRHHAKGLIADNEQLFIGGFNPTEHNTHWHEVCAAVSGPAVLEAQRNFNSVFRRSGRGEASTQGNGSFPELADGISCDAFLVANRPIDRDWRLTSFLMKAIDQACSSIRIENGYISSPEIMRGLLKAKERGVKTIQVISPAQSNHASLDKIFRKWIPKLLEAGIEVYIYPGMTHAKVISFDDLLVSVGSANFESFSLKYSNELNLFAIDQSGQVGKSLKEKLFIADIKKSFRVTKENLHELAAWAEDKHAT